MEISEIPEISFPLAGNVGALSTARLPPGAPRLPGISTPVRSEISGSVITEISMGMEITGNLGGSRGAELPREIENPLYRYLIAISRLRLGILTEQGEGS